MPKNKTPDRHDWNTIENYDEIYHKLLDNHSFIDHAYPLPEIEAYVDDHNEPIVAIVGDIHCKSGVVLAVEKYFNVRELKDGRLQIRCFSYRYNASLSGKYNVLRYDNIHASRLDYYHKHIFDLTNGKEIEKVPMTRNEFPVLNEIIDELTNMFGDSLT